MPPVPGERGCVCFLRVNWRERLCVFLECHFKNGVVCVSCVPPGEKGCVCFLRVTWREGLCAFLECHLYLETGLCVFLACHLERRVVCVS